MAEKTEIKFCLFSDAAQSFLHITDNLTILTRSKTDQVISYPREVNSEEIVAQRSLLQEYNNY